MIRRTPTLIPMNDNDVQTVRNMQAQKKAIAVAAAQATDPKGKTKDAPDLSAPFVAAEDAKKQRDAMSKEERLGIAS
jgi:hypothetical protein